MIELYFPILINLLNVVLSFIILQIYFNTFFEKSSRKKGTFICWTVYFFWEIGLMTSLNFPVAFNLCVSLFLIILICCIGYSGETLSKIILAFMISTLWTLMEFIVGNLLVFFEVDSNITYFWGTLLSKALILVLIKILQLYFKDENIAGLPNRYAISLLIIIAGNLYTMYNVFSLGMRARSFVIPLISLGILLVVNILTFRLYFKLAENMEIRMQNIVYAQQLELCTAHNHEKEALLLEYRNAKHDMKQHFITLVKYLEENDTSSAKEYLVKMIGSNPFPEIGISKSDNIIVDAIVNAKYASADELSISFDSQINVPIQLPFENGDISILLGNILDNAIEACEKVTPEQRKIDLIIKYDKNMLIVVCRNSFNGELIKGKRGELRTNKSNPVNHGLGLRAINKIANKYHGAVVFDSSDSVFTLRVTLYELNK